jgi:hypothetical protein
VTFYGPVLDDKHNMLEVGTSATVYVTLLSDSIEDCWDDDSEIWLEVDEGENQVEIFHNGQAYTSGTTILKKDFVGSFTVRATAVSTDWNDIKIVVKGVPQVTGSSSGDCYSCSAHEHDECDAALTLTNYSITIEVMERPWECVCDDSYSGSYNESPEPSCDSSCYGSWREPEEQGIHVVGVDEEGHDIIRPWYVLQAENEPAIRARVEPADLAEIVKDTSFQYEGYYPLSTREFSPEEEVPSTPINAQPSWKKFLYDGRTYLGVIATIYVSKESDSNVVVYTPVNFSMEPELYSPPAIPTIPVSGTKTPADIGEQWRIIRDGGATATAISGMNSTIGGLADKIGLKRDEFKKWLTLTSPSLTPSSEPRCVYVRTVLQR